MFVPFECAGCLLALYLITTEVYVISTQAEVTRIRWHENSGTVISADRHSKWICILYKNYTLTNVIKSGLKQG